MSSNSNLTPKQLKTLKKDELVRLVLDMQNTGVRNPDTLEGTDRNLTIDAATALSERTSPEKEPSFTLSQVKNVVVEAVQDLKSELRLEYLSLIDEIKSDFKKELENVRYELNLYKAKCDSSIQDMEVEFVRELHEAEQRKNNLMIFGMTESNEANPDERRECDLKRIKQMAQRIGVNNLDPQKVIRLGMVGDRPRPIKLVGLSNQTRDALLRSAPRIRGIDESVGLRNVFIKPDLTPKQQLSERLLRNKLRVRRAVGEQVVIRNGKIVPSDNHPPVPRFE